MFDESTKEWKPTYGYRRGNDDTEDWLIEIPDNAGELVIQIITDLIAGQREILILFSKKQPFCLGMLCQLALRLSLIVEFFQ